MFSRILRRAFSRWWEPLKNDWLKAGVWALITTGIAFLVMFFLIGVDELKIEFMAWLSVGIGFILTQFLRLLWLLLSTPFLIINEQDATLDSLDKLKVKPEIIEKLTRLRTEGVDIRNDGYRLIDQISLPNWIKEYENWNAEMLDTLSELSPGLAGWLTTLDRYEQQLYGRALNSQHQRYLGIFTEKLRRLALVLTQKLDLPSDI